MGMKDNKHIKPVWFTVSEIDTIEERLNSLSESMAKEGKIIVGCQVSTYAVKPVLLWFDLYYVESEKKKENKYFKIVKFTVPEINSIEDRLEVINKLICEKGGYVAGVQSVKFGFAPQYKIYSMMYLASEEVKDVQVKSEAETSHEHHSEDLGQE